MMPKNLALVLASVALSACATAEPSNASVDRDCPPEIQQIFASMIGEWTLTIRADEGWTGYGESTIAWTDEPGCGVIDATTSVFNQESETPLENSSDTILAYDKLSETIKVFTSDDRGYVHIGIAAAETPLSFNIIRSAEAPPTRQIQYRNIQADAFEWSWRGRAGPTDAWADRLVIAYSKAK